MTFFTVKGKITTTGLCPQEFGTYKIKKAQLGNFRGNKTQRISKCGQDISQESESKQRESISMQSSRRLQVVDSEYDVYVPQTNMEFEYALTIQKQLEELRAVQERKPKADATDFQTRCRQGRYSRDSQ